MGKSDPKRVKELISIIERRVKEENRYCIEVAEASMGVGRVDKVTVFYLPEDFVTHFLATEVETRFYFLNHAPAAIEVMAVGMVYEVESDELAKVLPLTQWDGDIFMDHGATEETYDGFRFLLKDYKITEEIFMVNLRDKVSGLRNTLKIVATKEITSFDEMEAEINRLFDVSWKQVSKELNEDLSGRVTWCSKT